MSKVLFTYRNGVQKTMSHRYASILQKIGRGSYATRDMVAVNPSKFGDEFDNLDVPALLLLAKERGVKVHHKAGADKIRSALREAAK